jgi:hypothetical protein
MNSLNEEAIVHLRSVFAAFSSNKNIKPNVSAGPEVIARYQSIFSSNGIEILTEESFREFLMFRNNRHWSGLQRMGPAITSDMDKLKAALRELADESVPISKRLDRLLPSGRARVKKLGKAVLTPILLIMHPEQYGVWNSTSEAAMRKLGLWPLDLKNDTIGTTYDKVNNIIKNIAFVLGTDLWTLDAVWWSVLKLIDPPVSDDEPEISGIESITEQLDNQQFGLERQLHEFLVDNWEKTEIGKEWILCEEGGDVEGYGSERQTDVGIIDLLAKHKNESRWLVIELKRDQTSDRTVGQILRYMGWVKKNLATQTETVEGLVIALSGDDRLRYALLPVPNVRFMKYEVSFKLISGV